jgi:hypothetical protein
MKPKALRRLPTFVPVPVRARSDGWTPERQAAFLGLLAETGSVRAAAERLGMARETAYRLRTKPHAESFIAAWDAILCALQGGPLFEPRKVTLHELEQRALFGHLRPLMWRGKFVSVLQQAEPTAFYRWYRRRFAWARGRRVMRVSASGDVM